MRGTSAADWWGISWACTRLLLPLVEVVYHFDTKCSNPPCRLLLSVADTLPPGKGGGERQKKKCVRKISLKFSPLRQISPNFILLLRNIALMWVGGGLRLRLPGDQVPPPPRGSLSNSLPLCCARAVTERSFSTLSFLFCLAILLLVLLLLVAAGP